MKKISFLAAIIGLLFIINNQTRSLYDLWQKKDLVLNTQKELEYLKNENKKLKSELSYAQTDEFIEKEARDKLLFVKEGEQQVLIPKEAVERQAQEQEIRVPKPNWKKWWELFFLVKIL